MKKLKKLGLILGTIVLVLGAFWGIVNIIPPKKVADSPNPWLAKDKPMISAHRGGAFLNPENTEKAFDYVIIDTHYCDIVEIDIHKTKDNIIVINHDPTLDRVALEGTKATDEVEDVVIKDSTYEELLNYNLGRNFEDRNKNKPYENLTIDEADQQGLTIMTLEEFLVKYENYNFKLYLEIKESGEDANVTADMVHSLFTSTKYSSWKDRTMIISFTNSVIDYIIEKYPDLYVGALGYKIAAQLVTQTLGLGSLASPKYHSLQTQMTNTAGPITINCATKAMVRGAHRRNQSVTYWTINEKEQMEKIIDIGADVITTNAPDVLAELLGKN